MFPLDFLHSCQQPRKQISPEWLFLLHLSPKNEHTGNRSKHIPASQSLEETCLDPTQSLEPSQDTPSVGQPSPNWSADTWAGNKHYGCMPLRFCGCLLNSSNCLISHMLLLSLFLHNVSHIKKKRKKTSQQDIFITKMESFIEEHTIIASISPTECFFFFFQFMFQLIYLHIKGFLSTGKGPKGDQNVAMY